eukprot:1918930-Prymnesium_polylepis.1
MVFVAAVLMDSGIVIGMPPCPWARRLASARMRKYTNTNHNTYTAEVLTKMKITASAASQRPSVLPASRVKYKSHTRLNNEGRSEMDDGLRAPRSTPPSPLTAKPGAGRLPGSTPIPSIDHGHEGPRGPAWRRRGEGSSFVKSFGSYTNYSCHEPAETTQQATWKIPLSTVSAVL